MYRSGIREVNIIYRSRRANTNADALLRNPYAPAPQEGRAENEIQVATINSETITDVSTLLKATPMKNLHTPLKKSRGRTFK